MNSLHVKKGDTVLVLSGRDKGKKGKILSADPSKGMAVVEGINFVKRHRKPRRQGEQGGIIRQEGNVRACKLQLFCTKCSKSTRIAHKVLADGSKIRVCKHCGVDL